MKRSIQIQIGLVVVSIFVLIGVLFYNPKDVEKPTEIVVDFGDGNPRAVGGGSGAASAQPDAESVNSTDAQPDPASLKPVDKVAPDEKLNANTAVHSPTPSATSAKAALLPKGTPVPLTPRPTPTMAPAGSNRVLFPGGPPGQLALETTVK